jgi:CRISPR-associated protein Cas2
MISFSKWQSRFPFALSSLGRINTPSRGIKTVLVVVTYDIQTSTPEGRRRLRQTARACLDYGQRVQFSVFELSVNPAQWTACRERLLRIIDQEVDSVRFYHLGSASAQRVEHHGTKASFDLDGPLIV